MYCTALDRSKDNTLSTNEVVWASSHMVTVAGRGQVWQGEIREFTGEGCGEVEEIPTVRLIGLGKTNDGLGERRITRGTTTVINSF